MLAIFTAGIFAVSVTGTFNTFSSGTLLKSSDINANFATLKAAIESIPSQPSMRLIYETDVTSATNTVTVSGLDGNTDIEYHLSIRFVNPSAGGCTYYLKPNNDSSSIYGFQEAGGNAAAGSFARLTGLNTGMLLSDSNSGTSATLALYDGNFIVKTGAARGLLSLTSRQVSGDLISIAEVMNSMWNNSSSNITSLVFTSGSNCIGAGSHIEVWARR